MATGAVAQHGQAVRTGVVLGENAKVALVRKRAMAIEDGGGPALGHAAGDGTTGQPGADSCGDVGHRSTPVHLQLVAVGKSNSQNSFSKRTAFSQRTAHRAPRPRATVTQKRLTTSATRTLHARR